jgi:hypothetical protein
MPIQVECEDCGKRYKLNDASAGKRGKCRNCGNVFTIPAADAVHAETVALEPAAAPRARSVAVRRPAARPRKAPATAPQSATADEMGFDLGALENLERTGTVDNDYTPVPLAPPPLAAAPSRPVPMARPLGMPQRRPAVVSGLDGLIRFVPWVLLGGFLLLGIAIGILSGSVAVGLVGALIIVGFLLALAGSLWGVVVPFMESILCGLLYLFLPLYPLYYLITRWDEMRRPFWLSMGGSVLVIVGFLIAMVAFDPAAMQ